MPVRPQPPAQRVTVEWLKSLKTTSNDPAGDGFIGSRDQLSRSIDAIVADSSLVSPTYLFIASKTALTLNRVEDAGFLFYAAQLRTAFDFERYDAPRQPDGNNAATYLGFLRQTIGESVNPAIMREPARFTAAMNRLDRWELVPVTPGVLSRVCVEPVQDGAGNLGRVGGRAQSDVHDPVRAPAGTAVE